MSELSLFNSLTRSRETFIPLDSDHVRMYVCGPTVYSSPHIGNMRSVVVYDLLFRLLKHLYKKVTYVRNITDIDDKIINAANSEGKDAQQISEYYNAVFHKYAELLNCESPTFEPKATENINNIINMIGILIEKRNAYEVNGHVYFDVWSYANYGQLSGRKLKDMSHGARVDVSGNKKSPGDFVLWKPDNQVYWESPWGNGRPGWHIECSAMSTAILGNSFDIHGGGVDLKFPHHENEIAQSCAANHGSIFAKYWVHNGSLLVNGQKMSKSLNNIIDLNCLISSAIKPEVIRYALLSSHYNKPLDWKDEIVREASSSISKFKNTIMNYLTSEVFDVKDDRFYSQFIGALCDNLNTPAAMRVLHELNSEICINDINSARNAYTLNECLGHIGFSLKKSDVDECYILKKIAERNEFKRLKQYKRADEIRDDLKKDGVALSDNLDGKTSWVKL